MIVCGIDPGNTGGLVFANTDNGVVNAYETPVFETIKQGKKLPSGKPSIKREIDLYQVKALLTQHDPTITYIERVHSMPKNGAVSSFTFGQSYGGLRGLLVGCGCATELVTPQKWKKHYLIPTGADKDESRARASQLAPGCAAAWNLKRLNGVAEALLICLYGVSQSGFRCEHPWRLAEVSA